MRVLVLNQFFWPDPAATSQFLTDLARGLALEGHSVTAICSAAEYAHRPGTAPEKLQAGKRVNPNRRASSDARELRPGTAPGNCAGERASPNRRVNGQAPDTEKTTGIRIVRVRGVRFSRGRFGRVVSYLSFYAGALWRAVWLPKQDVVLTLTTPPLLCLVGTVLKSLRGSRHYIWEMDVYPDVAVALGVLRAGSGATRVLGALANFSRRRADGVIALGECMRARLDGKVTVIENWADSREIWPLPFPEGPLTVADRDSEQDRSFEDAVESMPARMPARPAESPRHERVFINFGGPQGHGDRSLTVAARMRSDSEQDRSLTVAARMRSDSEQDRSLTVAALTVLYSGNLGLAHDVDTIAGAMKELKEDGRIRFVFAGGGPRRAALEEFCRANGTATEFRPYCEREGLPESLGGCHIGLVTQNPATLGCVVPSKTYALMAAGRAVLYIGPREATPARIVERFGCGWQVECGDVAGLCGVLRRLVENSEEVAEAGRRARAAFLAEYDFPWAFERFRGALGVHH